MDDYFKQLKEELKSIKKELKTLLASYEQELEHCTKISEKMSVIKMGYDQGISGIKFDKSEIERKIPTFCECNKYSKEIDRLELIMRNCNVEIDNPDITIRSTKPYASGIAISQTEGEDAIELLREKQHPDKFEDVSALFEQFLKGDIEQAFKLSKLYHNFYNYAWSIDYYLTNINMLINAIDNDRIKAPIKDITVLYTTMIMLKIPPQDITKILGKAIVYNENYLRKDPAADIKHIELIKALTNYYNEDGTIKANINISTFKRLLNTLKDDSLDYFNMVTYLINLIRLITKDKNKFNDNYLTIYLVCDKINESIINQIEIDIKKSLNSPKIVVSNLTTTTKQVDRTFLNILKQYYKNGEIIAIPENIDLFYQQLFNSSLDKTERKLIKKLMEEAITIRKNQIRLSYLTLEEKNIYVTAAKLIETLSHDNPDLYLLKENLSDLHEIFDILDSNQEDKEDWIKEIRSIMISIALMCNTYMYKQPNSTNSLVFLLNKNNIPYIYEDFKGLESTYQKAISSLITRINIQNTANFKSVRKTHKEEYQLYEYNSPIAHIFFIEVTPGIYIVIGADKAYYSYDEMTNRLRSNITKIKELEYEKISKYNIKEILELLGKDAKNIVYCDNKNEAVTWSKDYADSLLEIEQNYSIEEVKKYISDEIHKDYYLIETLKKGVAYHVGYVPTSIRKHIENLYLKVQKA